MAGGLPQQVIEEGHSIRALSRVPGPVVALVTMTLGLVSAAGPAGSRRSAPRFGGIPQTLPELHLPPFSWQSAKELLIPTLTIAILGAIESLLCARVADNLSDTSRHDPNQELDGAGRGPTSWCRSSAASRPPAPSRAP